MDRNVGGKPLDRNIVTAADLPYIADEAAAAVTVCAYIAGPMTGYEDFNHPAFHAAAEQLRLMGYEVRSPTDTDGGSQGKPWAFYMRHDLRLLLECDEVVVLPGWEASRGASLEVFIACQLGMKVTPVEALVEGWEAP